MTDLPTWDEMTDVDKGCALLHLWKRDAEGASYAVENYPAQYLDDPRLVALDGRDACRHAVTVGVSNSAAEKRLGFDEYVRLYDLALDEPERRMLWAARNEDGRVVPVETRERAEELLTVHWPASDDRYAAMYAPPSWWTPADRSKWALLQRTEAGGEWTEVELTSAAN